MAQYCEIAKTVTNCTDNCRTCLEEETKTRKIEVGDKVRYIIDAATTKECPEFYPPKGTVGTVLWVGYESGQCYIQWPEGTTEGSGRWHTEIKSVELV